MDIRDLQSVVTAGTCSSRLVFNVPKARSQGFELELAATPDEHFDFSVAGSYTDSEIVTTVEPSNITGIKQGNRLPSVPTFKGGAAAGFKWQVMPGSQAFVTGTYSYVGSRFTQIGDHVPNYGTFNLVQPGVVPNDIGGVGASTTFSFNPEMPAYSLANVRVGVTRAYWEAAFFVNNIFDERAFLALDRERNRYARVGYLTNEPRTFGVSMTFTR
jgi:iron complex outermembrane receptor protein